MGEGRIIFASAGCLVGAPGVDPVSSIIACHVCSIGQCGCSVVVVVVVVVVVSVFAIASSSVVSGAQRHPNTQFPCLLSAAPHAHSLVLLTTGSRSFCWMSAVNDSLFRWLLEGSLLGGLRAAVLLSGFNELGRKMLSRSARISGACVISSWVVAAWQKRSCVWGLEEMRVSLVRASSFLIVLSVMFVVVSMRFQGLSGAVDAGSVLLNGHPWCAASLERASGQIRSAVL